MHICVVPHIFPARSETFVLEHVLGLARRGHRVTVVARSIGSTISVPELQYLDEIGIDRFYLGEWRSRLVTGMRAVVETMRNPLLFSPLTGAESALRRKLLLTVAAARRIRECKPDVVHFHFGDHAARMEQLASKLHPLPPMLVTWHGYDANAVPNTMGLGVYKSLFATDTVHSVGSQFVKDRLMTLGAKQNLVKIVPMGVDIGKFSYIERRPDTTRPLTILSVGRLDVMKGHTYLISAIGKLVKRGLAVRLRIVGEGRLRHTLERQIEDESLGSIVTLLGAMHPAQVAEEMQAADLFALTGVPEANGKVESQGVVYIEAQATGLPVIGSDIGGVPDSMQDGVTGKLCAPYDIDAIQDSIEYFVTHREEVGNFGARGRSFVEQFFSIEQMLDRFEALYVKM